jgi:hypothetical protein
VLEVLVVLVLVLVQQQGLEQLLLELGRELVQERELEQP